MHTVVKLLIIRTEMFVPLERAEALERLSYSALLEISQRGIVS